ESITDKLPAVQRLSLATHALTGPAKKWYKDWEGNPRTWTKFREDLGFVFVSEDRLCERLTRAVSYTSDSANSYSEYACNKLKHYGQTQIDFKPHELISLVIGHVTDAKSPQARPFSHKRCFKCSEVGHIERECPKKRNRETNNTLRKKVTADNVTTCAFCHKRRHTKLACWAKQRTPSNAQHKKKPEANVCYSIDHKLTPILLKDMLVRSCLIDNGATCFLVRERVAKQAGCKIEPYAVSVQGLCDSSTTTTGCTIIQTQDVSTELDLFVVPNEGIPYDVIIGKNVLAHADLQIVTGPDGTTRLQRCTPDFQGDNEEAARASCNILHVSNDVIPRAVRDLLTRFKQMLTTGNEVWDRYPLPLIEDQLDRLGKGKLFTTLDMAAGFHQIPIAADSIDKTAFVTTDGHYEYLRMPFGLCNAPAVFQKAINTAFGSLRNSTALVYLDDILIPSQTVEQGLRDLERVLEALDKAGFTLNIEKCKFFETSIKYLDREISAAGIKPDKEKIKALVESPVPHNVRQ
ncbi:uncharacterized protein LOC108631976, partial [Ceratina calcarata]|uniref:Uncharacterized protein LOC108631976 n=1 Tax=Ceratina calcarata TaxID=156304 RepID=A0AAJ7SCU6_9HYME